MNNPKPAVRYLLYVRKSTDAEDRQMASLTDQEDVMHRLAEERGIEIVDVIREAKSAKQPGRAGFNQLLSRISKGEANGILCWKLNRLARNPVDGGQISWMLQNGVIRHIQTFASDYKPEDNVLMMQVEFGIANQYIKNLSQDVKRGMLQKARRGWSPQRTLPLGYKHKRDYQLGDVEIVADPDLFPKIARLWRLMLTGKYTVTEIKQVADASGIRNKKGKPFHVSTYYSLFNYPFYYGEFEWKDEFGKPIVFVGKHTPMITKREYQKVQAYLRNRGRPVHADSYDFAFKGVFTCGQCGCSVTVERKVKTICQGCRRKFSIRRRDSCPDCGMKVEEMEKPTITDRVYYRCTKKKGPCSEKYLEEEALDKLIQSRLEQIDIPRKYADLFLNMIERESQDLAQDQENLVAELQSNKKQLETKLESLVDLRVDGEITKDQFQRKKAAIESEISQINHQIQYHESEEDSWATAIAEKVQFGREIVNTYLQATEEGKKEMVMAIGSNPHILGQKPYFSMPEVLLMLKEVVEAYEVKNGRLEPDLDLISQGVYDDNHPLIRAMRGVAGFARTQNFKNLRSESVTNRFF